MAKMAYRHSQIRVRIEIEGGLSPKINFNPISPPHYLVEGLVLVGDGLVVTLGAVAVDGFDAVAAEGAEQVVRLKQSGDVKLSR